MRATRREGLVLAVLLGSVWVAQSGWRGRADAAAASQLAALAQPGDIVMFSSATCSICAAARAWFTEHRVAFSECVIERDDRCRAEFEASGAPGTPLIKVRGRAQLGFSPPRLLAALQTMVQPQPRSAQSGMRAPVVQASLSLTG